ncbi:MAG TPA: hypothetical protein VL993_02160 [Stellaceae bacterium]|nr:hypothetical protein [Stellaceae bacterium]
MPTVTLSAWSRARGGFAAEFDAGGIGDGADAFDPRDGAAGRTADIEEPRAGLGEKRLDFAVLVVEIVRKLGLIEVFKHGWPWP